MKSQSTLLSFFETKPKSIYEEDNNKLHDAIKRTRDSNDKTHTEIVKKGARLQAPFVPIEEATVEKQAAVSVEREFFGHKLDLKQRQEKRRSLGQSVEEPANQKTGEEKWSETNRWATDIRDEQHRLPTDVDYDPSTLYIPPEAFRQLSPFQKQFWELKRKHYDIVLFFKKGKFYELYDCDADIGHSVLGLNYTAGGRVEMRCVGVPETSFARYASKLVDNGYKVGRVEQVETTTAAAQRRRSSDSVDSKIAVCQRSLVRIMTKGSLTVDELNGDPSSHFLLCIHQCIRSEKIGFFYLDVSAGYSTVGEMKHDAGLADLEAILLSVQPVEIIAINCQQKGPLSELLKYFTSTTNCLLVHQHSSYGYSQRGANFPTQLEEFLLRHSTASIALFGCLEYLKSLYISVEVLRFDSTVIWDKCCTNEHISKNLSNEVNWEDRCLGNLSLIGSTIFNLEIVTSRPNKIGGHTLLSFIDHTATAGGKRLIKQWICTPLICRSQIERRLDSIEIILRKDSKSNILDQVRKQLSQFPDIERQIVKIQNMAYCSHQIVMFDDSEKRKVLEFLKFLKCLDHAVEFLKKQLPVILFPEFDSFISFIQNFDNNLLHKCRNVLDDLFNEFPDLDRTENGEMNFSEDSTFKNEIEGIELRLQRILEDFREQMNIDIQWFHRFREAYQLEFSQSALEKTNIPDDFVLMSQTSDKKRFWTPEIKQLVKKRNELLEAHTISESSKFKKILQKFDDSAILWRDLAKIISELDALFSLARTSRSSTGMMCRPEIIDSDIPRLVVEELRHPCLADMGDLYASGSCRTFIPVSLNLGGVEGTSFVIRGPNMGGKSTLLREICLGVILAQCGCYVPAKKFQFTLFDKIFTRMGASDAIGRGQSTFLLEVQEAAAILNTATKSSLVVIDELGRGTSTYDGYAIAKAVLNDISTRIGCLCFFSTHYHNLIHEKLPSNIRFFEMQAEVDEEKKDVTFLYTLKQTSTSFVSSRGVYCAKMANLPGEILIRAEDPKVRALLNGMDQSYDEMEAEFLKVFHS
ncbi:DNA mismatch repair protein MutS isoform 1 [Galdieria sulphuraria]|uniref:DNA mismatch repair protein MutS isoform 1 n=1 Tax=Galdieria sulphuraria TaxID=130081 RepID=M2X125_GALSU|nr:DNA mismatch repair protein MutS isoform 1 [Galdieria sulphuraria]EME30065.1 DNA mismatch repair protein MutS isoform 1 [Galdieria sulphuraria]|eukprot:XP_005706585.1 DNA mismatch repair protein MutS isoform 1 [Galdieria sulphuraria]